jgi:hypothetical protein
VVGGHVNIEAGPLGEPCVAVAALVRLLAWGEGEGQSGLGPDCDRIASTLRGVLEQCFGSTFVLVPPLPPGPSVANQFERNANRQVEEICFPLL